MWNYIVFRPIGEAGDIFLGMKQNCLKGRTAR